MMMKFNIGLILALGGAIAGVRAEGINCKGNARCAELSLYTQVKNYVDIIDRVDPNRWYNNGEHIACIKADVPTGLYFSDHISSCVFLQNSGGAPGHSLPPLIKLLRKHGCKGCGSVPLFAPQGNNNVADGELTVNYVSNTNGCDSGLC
jgi:hypothetical protein